MFSLSLPPITLAALASGPVAADDGAKPDESGDAFAALLGALGAVATGAPAKAAQSPRAGLPKGGKGLPDDTEAATAAADLVDSASIDADDPTAQFQVAPTLLALPAPISASVASAPIPAAADAPRLAPQDANSITPRIEPGLLAVLSSPTGKNPVIATSTVVPPPSATLPGLPVEAAPLASSALPAPASATEAISPQPNQALRKSDTPRRGSQLAASLPANAAVQAGVEHEATANGPPAIPPTLPEQAAARATAALEARGNPEHRARASQAFGPVVAAAVGEADPLPPTASPRPVEARIAQRARSSEWQPASTPVAIQGDPFPVPDPSTAATPATAPPSARFDFAAVIDRLIEARDLAVAQPSAMTIKHDDFGAVSLRFRQGDDGLSVTMASPDPDFARAVNAAVAPGAAANQGGDPAPSRQQGGGGTVGDESRSGGRSSDRDRGEPSRQRGDPAPSHRPAPRRGGIFA